MSAALRGLLTGGAGLLLVGLLAACGGGGGGGGSSSGVEFSALAASRTSFEVAEGARLPDIGLTAQVSGNLATLDGKTLYVLIDDPLGLFAAASGVTFNAQTGRAGIALSGREQSTVGRRSGRLGVRVCLDAACQSSLTPAGYGIDVAVTVRSGLRTSPTQQFFRVPFGTLPGPALVRVTVPEGRDPADYSAGIVAGASGEVFDLTRQQTPGAEGVLVAPRLLPVGRYERRLEVSASSVDLGAASSAAYVQEVPLVLEVEPSDVDFAVLPSSLSFTFDQGSQEVRPFTVGAVAQSGSFRLDPVVYDLASEPPGTAYPLRGTWLWTLGEAWTVGVCQGTACLPRGTYRAHLPFVRLTSAGVPTGQVVEVPVELTVR